MSLPKFKDVENRSTPCEEYPGTWITYLPIAYEGKKEHHFTSQIDARRFGQRVMMIWEDSKMEYDPSLISVCWSASDDDPRIGKNFFTGFYCHGKFNLFGEYRTT